MLNQHSYYKISTHNLGARRLFSIFSSKRSSAITDVPNPPKREFLKDKMNKMVKKSSFKYWFIGGTCFLSWMTYYGLKSYKKTRLDIEVLPPLPTHVTVARNADIAQLSEKYQMQNSLFGAEKIKKLIITGACGSGKTILVHDFARMLLGKQSSQYSLPKSKILVFLQADTEETFLLSLKAFAAKFKIKSSALDDAIGNSFNKAPFDEQCNALLSCIQDSIKKHPDWIVVVDNVQITSPPSVVNVINKWFMSDEQIDAWSRGSVFVVHDGIERGFFNLKENYKHVNYGLNEADAYHLLQEIVNIDRAVPISNSFKYLIDKLCLNPLAIVCAGILLQERLSLKEAISIDTATNNLCKEIDVNLEQVKNDNIHISEFIATKSGLKLVTVETIVAMTIKHIFSKDRYLWHGFDMLATIKPGAAVPQSLLARHLKNPLFKLPPLNQSPSTAEFFNKQQNDISIVQSKADEFEPKGKVWSNKNLSEYVRKIEDFFTSGINIVKDIYNLVYGELPVLPEKPDGLDMFRGCELLQTSIIEPGDTKAISIHPLVYNAARQYFLSATVPNMENEKLMENELRYLNQSWYKRLSSFSEQSSLYTLRTSAGHPLSNEKNPMVVLPQPVLLRYNHGINIGSILKFEPFDGKKEDFWILKDIDKYGYLQSHVSRVCKSLCDDISVAKGDVSGRSAKNILLLHLEYILNNHPIELFGLDGRIEAFQSIASCYSSLFSDLVRSKSMLEDTLKLQKSSSSHPLDIAKTLTKVASIHQAYEEYSDAKTLLEEAAELHEADRRKSGEYKESLEFGKLLGQLGVVYGSLNMKREAKETIERSLMLKQVQPPDLSDEPKSKQYGADFSTSLTDLGHAYVSLGMPLYGKKILDLALAAQKNLLGENHPEVVRTLTVLAVAHLMQGHNEESKKLRFEAGKIQANINALPVY